MTEALAAVQPKTKIDWRLDHNRRDIINAILEIPEEDFWDLIDSRLNRPKGMLRLPGQERLEIIDANDKPSMVERWTEECLIDALFLELATTKSLVSHNGRCDIIIHIYYNQALALRKWISIARPPPAFVVDSSDLSTRVVAELKVLNRPQIILKQAVGRIFENVDELQYHMAIAMALEVVLK
jgi:hypothetical protein